MSKMLPDISKIICEYLHEYEEPFQKIDWDLLSSSPHPVEITLLPDTFDKIDWDSLSKIPDDSSKNKDDLPINKEFCDKVFKILIS
jgi:hypothetical protein